MRNHLILPRSFALILLAFLWHSIQAQTDKEIADTLRERIEIGKTVHGIAVAVIDAKGTRFINYGKRNNTADAKKIDAETLFEIGSITKAFTGILLALAVERGEVRLDDPISKYLPNSVKTPLRNGKEITLLDLATHSSGLSRMPTNFEVKNVNNPYADYTVEQMYEFLSTYELKRDIGSQYEYSNVGMGLLGHILSLRARTSYEDLVKTRILKPLKMNDTTMTLSDNLRAKMSQGFDDGGEPVSNWDLPTLAGAGALRSNTKDMAKFLAANMGLVKSKISSALAESHKFQRNAGGNTMKIGLGWHILPTAEGEIIWHNGGTGGFRTFAGFLAGKKKAIVVLCNTSDSPDDVGLHYLDPSKPLKKIRTFIFVSEQVLDEYVGEYELAPKVIFTITRSKEKLFAQLTGQQRFRVFPETENKFYLNVVPAQLTFNRKAEGKIESLTLTQNGEQTARKIK